MVIDNYIITEDENGIKVACKNNWYHASCKDPQAIDFCKKAIERIQEHDRNLPWKPTRTNPEIEEFLDRNGATLMISRISSSGRSIVVWKVSIGDNFRVFHVQCGRTLEYYIEKAIENIQAEEN